MSVNNINGGHFSGEKLSYHELLEEDRRPSFFVNISKRGGPEHSLAFSFANAALEGLSAVITAVKAGFDYVNHVSPDQQTQLPAWLNHCLSLSPTDMLPPFEFCNLTWDVCALSDSWILVSARPVSTNSWRPATHGVQGRPPKHLKFDMGRDNDYESPPHRRKLSVESMEIDVDARIAAAAQTDAELLRCIEHIRPVGLLLANPAGEIVFANDYWYDLTKHPRDHKSSMEWLEVFDDDEIPRIRQLWFDKINTSDVVSYPAKLRRRWNPPPEFAEAGDNEPMWLHVSGHTNVENGVTVGATGCFVDISSQKWLEKQQKQLLDKAIDRAEQSEQVATKSIEAVASQSRFSKLCDDLAVGVYIADANATISYANQAYWNILGVPASNDPLVWVTAMTEKSLEMAAVGFRKVYEEKMPVDGIEIELKRHFSPSGQDYSGQHESRKAPHAWVWFQAFPELKSNGDVHQVVGCVTDISHQKWVEGFISQQKEDAVAARLQQERFSKFIDCAYYCQPDWTDKRKVDMTSHEMRNPIAAVIHCADEIIETLTHESADIYQHSQIHDVLSAANTILTCSQHARRIMDDVLTFSKMGARLLKIHPVPCQPVEVFRDALNIFHGDALASAATLEYRVHESIKELHIDWTFLDQGRCIQIIANLVTNALKFVRNQTNRAVVVTLAASLGREPMTTREGFRFLDSDTVRKAAVMDADKPEGQDIFIHVVVDDTGCGIAASEQAKLFGRFFQASHKTHIQYGGSGLGLLISKELCELQAGQIGFASEYGKGSTFSFYVRTTRTTPPDRKSSIGTREIRTSKHPGSPSPATELTILPDTSVPISTKKIQPAVSPYNIHVLLVEDNLTNQRVLQRQLLRAKHGCTVANNGVEALEAIKMSEYWRDCVEQPQKLSLILLDVEMPVMGGFECIRRIRELEKEGSITGHIPVVAVTANARREQIDEALDAGMDDVLCKPFQFRELAKVIERWIPQSR